ncbi:inositol polyphosphate phosphatase [Laccaria bicolor S238N-H82]|uniref:Inositol polyphosphate phosphatase n=1 Tax=Laccaria bicolor (strain S238N-H82 / ATCC MYA-4686) TaxID=486041 RepID=B0CSS7_LACBS|nr:inositol polyphosphate phosphatase [Laccaria bicolor S238N-H82]EDR14895.1 inositol polyphosphate phosphatase [Laccaria bicolor S238N-H82]|eukprot:XP_001875454.1 inositol polyphosphate phosphatase [Laccaria bicolor S238N-H82]
MSLPDRLLVQIASYNTNLQGVLGLPQDLVDWLAPTLQVSNFLFHQQRAPDIIAVGFQELLPLHLGLSGLSKAVLSSRNALILSQIEEHAPNKESYTLIAKVVNVGVALLVYGRDAGIARKVCDVQTQWTGCGLAYMGNKGAVGVRFRVLNAEGDPGETYTFVNCHLAAFDHRVEQRNADFRHIVSTLLFPPVTDSSSPSTIYETSHLFLLGDLNYRLDIPPSHPLFEIRNLPGFSGAIDSEATRKELGMFDQLTTEKQKGHVFMGLHEGDFWKFKCSYKYQLGETDKYSTKRTPSWTDRILYATYSDSPDTPGECGIANLLYTSIPSYTTSDHKPIICLLLLPPSTPNSSSSIPLIRLPATYVPLPDRRAALKRYVGRILDRIVGVIWWLLTLLGAGSGIIGSFNFFLGLGAWKWWKASSLV